jgi:hypothetical protein
LKSCQKKSKSEDLQNDSYEYPSIYPETIYFIIQYCLDGCTPYRRRSKIGSSPADENGQTGAPAQHKACHTAHNPACYQAHNKTLDPALYETCNPANATFHKTGHKAFPTFCQTGHEALKRSNQWRSKTPARQKHQ